MTIHRAPRFLVTLLKWTSFFASATELAGLGAAYEMGYGVKKDLHKAVHFYRKAASRGNLDAQDALARLLDGERGSG